MTQAEVPPGEPVEPVPAVRIQRTVSASPEVVWRAFTDPNALAAWFWPARLSPRVQVEAHVGGRYQIASAAARSMATAVSGEFLTVTEPELLEFTWCWEGADGTARVSVRFAPVDDGTEVSVEHAGCDDEEDRDAQARGWRDCLGRLPDWLAAATARSIR